MGIVVFINLDLTLAMLVVSTQAQDMRCLTSLAKITFLDGASNQSSNFTYIIHIMLVIYMR